MQKASRQHRSAGKSRGFTLTEILLVVAIIVVVGGLGGGVYVGSYKRLLVEKAARQFLLTAKYARIAAIEQQRPYELELDEGNRGFMLTTTRWNEETGQTERIMVRNFYCRPVEFEGDVKFEDVRVTTLTADQTTGAEQERKILFMPSGSAQSAVVQIGDGKSHYTVAVVAATGKANLYSGEVGEIKTASVDLDAR